MPETHKDFFISYVDVDCQWAQWIAWQLEDAKYSVYLQEWDLRPVSYPQFSCQRMIEWRREK